MVTTLDPLGFVDLETYPERVREAQAKTGLERGHRHRHGEHRRHAVRARRHGLRVHGRQHGERRRREALARAPSWPSGEDLPLVAVCTSGGARMQEGILSLMQMAKTSCAVDLINEATSPFVDRPRRPVHRRRRGQLRDARRHLHRRARRAALLHRAARHPADHPARSCPQGFSTAERNLELGHLDAVVARKDLRVKVGNYLRLLGGGEEPDRGEGSEDGAGRSGRLAQAAVERARTLATYARRSFVRGDREAPERG